MKRTNYTKNGKSGISSGSSLKSGYLRVKGAADYLGTTESSIRHMIDRGHLKAYRLGRCVYLSRDEIDQMMRERRSSSGYF